MTCDDNDNLPSEETQEKTRDLKRKLDVQTFDINPNNLNYNENKVIKTKASEECIKILTPDTKTTNQASLVHHEHQENTKTVEAKKSKVMSNYSRKKTKRLEIETEFKILQSLIPKIANKQQINELEIIDACVNYIEALQEQLNIRNPQDTNCTTDDTTMSTTSIRSIMSAITDEKAEGGSCFYQIQDDDVDDYLNSESSEEDCSDDEFKEDKNNNKATEDKETNLTDTSRTNNTEHVVDSNMQVKIHASEDNKSMVVDTNEDLSSNVI